MVYFSEPIRRPRHVGAFVELCTCTYQLNTYLIELRHTAIYKLSISPFLFQIRFEANFKNYEIYELTINALTEVK